jgi:hypothetical protein
VVLLDAPGSVRDLTRTTALHKPEQREQADAAIAETCTAFGLRTRASARADPDWLQRLVLVHYLRRYCDIQAWSIRMCFVNPTVSPYVPDFPTGSRSA